MKTRIMYLRDNNNPNGRGNPIGCIAIKVVQEGKDYVEVKYHVSVLHPTDSFNRKVARNIALARLEKSDSDKAPPFIAGTLDLKDLNNHEISTLVMSHISNNSRIANRARKAAKNWLATAEGMAIVNSLSNLWQSSVERIA